MAKKIKKSHSFGSQHDTFEGIYYDSKQESTAAKTFRLLQTEGIISGMIPHPHVHGLDFDFLVTLGRTVYSGGEKKPLRKGSVILIEYDGLVEDRKRDLSFKVDRHKNLQMAGIEVRWLLGRSYEEVRDCILNYTPPHFVKKHMYCNCGHEKHILVIAKKEANWGLDGITRRYKCDTCKPKKK